MMTSDEGSISFTGKTSSTDRPGMISDLLEESRLIVSRVVTNSENMISLGRRSGSTRARYNTNISDYIGMSGAANIPLDMFGGILISSNKVIIGRQKIHKAITERNEAYVLNNIEEWMLDGEFYHLLGKYPLFGLLEKYPPKLRKEEDQIMIFLNSCIVHSSIGNVEDYLADNYNAFFKTIYHLSRILPVMGLNNINKIKKSMGYKDFAASVITTGDENLYNDLGVNRMIMGRIFHASFAFLLGLAVQTGNEIIISLVYTDMVLTIRKIESPIEIASRYMRMESLSKDKNPNKILLRGGPLYRGVYVDSGDIIGRPEKEYDTEKLLRTIRYLVNKHILVTSNNKIQFKRIYSLEYRGYLEYLVNEGIEFEPEFTGAEYERSNKVLDKFRANLKADIHHTDSIRTVEAFKFAYYIVAKDKNELLEDFCSTVTSEDLLNNVLDISPELPSKDKILLARTRTMHLGVLSKYLEENRGFIGEYNLRESLDLFNGVTGNPKPVNYKQRLNLVLELFSDGILGELCRKNILPVFEGLLETVRKKNIETIKLYITGDDDWNCLFKILSERVLNVDEIRVKNKLEKEKARILVDYASSDAKIVIDSDPDIIRILSDKAVCIDYSGEINMSAFRSNLTLPWR